MNITTCLNNIKTLNSNLLYDLFQDFRDICLFSRFWGNFENCKPQFTFSTSVYENVDKPTINYYKKEPSTKLNQGNLHNSVLS